MRSPGYVEKRIRLPFGAQFTAESRYSLTFEKPNLQKDPPKKHISLGPSSSFKTEETYSGDGTSAAPVIKSYADEFISELKVSGFKLKKSTLTPKGPVYEDLMEVTF